MTNDRIASTFEQVAALLEHQRASMHRVRAWSAAAQTLREVPTELDAMYREEGRAGIERLPAIGVPLAAAVIELLLTGQCSMLRRLRGEPVDVLSSVVGIGRTLAARIHGQLGIETLDELEHAAHDGRLTKVPGVGRRRLAIVRDELAQQLGRRHPPPAPPPVPPVEMLLEVDASYREARWLPVLHTERDGWDVTALRSSLPLAQRRGRTDDSVVLLCHQGAQPERQATVVTEWQLPLRGFRVVRGRERECREHYTRIGLVSPVD